MGGGVGVVNVVVLQVSLASSIMPVPLADRYPDAIHPN